MTTTLAGGEEVGRTSVERRSTKWLKSLLYTKLCFPSSALAHPLVGIESLTQSVDGDFDTYTTERVKMSVSNTTFTVFSGVRLFLSDILLSWDLQSWHMHVGTCMFMIWTALTCLVYFVDSIVWNGNAINWAPVWCDIGTFTYPFPGHTDSTGFI